MADVARVAGVSRSTVSYALSGVRPIAPETRERILKAMSDLAIRRTCSPRAWPANGPASSP
ncbi:LacI family DNA-binding transcriptional regulator [Arthrobacter sp. Hiyo1]|uniref:LacI family DNA-binding transcriptional regulator n=1 Tax=Arthrobacter sp. Hiyo1 TaxID=1588020 RepID=UPI000A05FD64